MISLVLAAALLAANTAPTPAAPATPAAASAASPSPTPLPKDALKPIDVDADLFDVNGKTKTGVFSGNVVARQGNVTIRASQVKATYSKSSNAIAKAVADGGVTVTSGNKVAKADRAEFDNEARTVILSGEPRLWEDGSVLEGKQIVFHVDDGRVECFACSLDVDPARVQQMQQEVDKTRGAPP